MKLLAVTLTFVALACAFRIPLPSDFAVESRHSERSVESSCNTYSLSCVSPGGNCTYTSSSVIPICLEGSCGFSSNLCPDVSTAGQSCVNTQCLSSLECNPVSQVCVTQPSIKPPGASCSSNTQCLYGTGSSAVANCASGVCQGTAIGSSCTGSNQCSGRAYCNSAGTCVALLTLGASCTASDVTIDAAVCNSGTVVTIGSVASGSSCTSSDACGDNQFCGGGVCVTPSSPGKLCTQNSDCASGETCSCDGTHTNSTCIGGISSPIGFTNTILNLARCSDSHSCIPGDFSCYQNNCASQYCAYRNLIVNEYAGKTDCLTTYYAGQLNNQFPQITCPSSASQHFVSLALVILVVVASLMF